MTAALDALSEALEKYDPPCAGEDLWTSEDRADRCLACYLCESCEVLDLCSRAGRTMTWGVWGGVDRSVEIDEFGEGGR